MLIKIVLDIAVWSKGKTVSGFHNLPTSESVSVSVALSTGSELFMSVLICVSVFLKEARTT